MIYENKDFKIFDMDGNIIDEIEIWKISLFFY
jgi:hypothetical protein